jgi:hypothetical protein
MSYSTQMTLNQQQKNHQICPFVRGKVYKLVVLHCALSRTILSFWPSGLAPAREEYRAPLTPLQRLLTTILWCAQSPADSANRENAIRLAVNANNHPANEYLGRILCISKVCRILGATIELLCCPSKLRCKNGFDEFSSNSCSEGFIL